MMSHDVDRIIEAELGREMQAPDLTRRIMGRLGYMQVPPAVAKRRRIQHLAGRAALVCVACVSAWVGVLAFQSSPEARGPLELTMPSAVRSDFQDSQQHMNSVIQLLRQLPPVIEVDGIDDDAELLYLDEDVDRSAVAPVRWV